MSYVLINVYMPENIVKYIVCGNLYRSQDLYYVSTSADTFCL